ncbi:MAG: DUF1993 domain-containing protein [Caulobacteraceae bacterium]
MYDVSVPVLVRGLGNLSNLLEKGLASAQARDIDPAVLVAARLAPDMHPLSRQVQIASDSAKGAASRLAGVDNPSWPDTETTFPELQARIKQTIDYLQAFKPEQFEGSESKSVILPSSGGEMKLTGQEFLFGFALPNFFFHVTMAHAILRHNGVPIGKADYLGGR